MCFCRLIHGRERDKRPIIGYNAPVELFNRPALPSASEALKALEAKWGESVLYRATGRFLTGSGVGAVPVDSWGLIALTPTRLLFRHYPQSHPLFGLKDKELNWSVDRDRFITCTPYIQGILSRFFSRTPDHVRLEGEGTQLLVEVTDDPRKLAKIWAQP
jgi:hypothetical protein